MADPAPDDAARDALIQEMLSGLLPRLNRLSRAITRGRLPERAIEATGLSLDRPGVTVLLTLHSADAPLRVGEIADRMQVVGPHVTRHVTALEKRGLVRRVADPSDQRARLVELTGSGSEAADAYKRNLFGWIAGVLADWPAQDREGLARLLGRLADDTAAHLDALDQD
ncbi:MarR family winged helix-turn-helix transcriptional regulator [Streptomyces sp. NPDC090052]|uniref:MarR family winged helix-turn-helix transcriptional regulator n=2 Tax=Streptomyces TaxID=1883 RepID=UPI0038279886